jgi:hypothetical protein
MESVDLSEREQWLSFSPRRKGGGDCLQWQSEPVVKYGVTVVYVPDKFGTQPTSEHTKWAWKYKRTLYVNDDATFKVVAVTLLREHGVSERCMRRCERKVRERAEANKAENAA